MGTLENILMSRYEVSLSRARKTVKQARENLDMIEASVQWTHALEEECIRVYEEKYGDKKKAKKKKKEVSADPVVSDTKKKSSRKKLSKEQRKSRDQSPVEHLKDFTFPEFNCPTERTVTESSISESFDPFALSPESTKKVFDPFDHGSFHAFHISAPPLTESSIESSSIDSARFPSNAAQDRFFGFKSIEVDSPRSSPKTAGASSRVTMIPLVRASTGTTGEGSSHSRRSRRGKMEVPFGEEKSKSPRKSKGSADDLFGSFMKDLLGDQMPDGKVDHARSPYHTTKPKVVKIPESSRAAESPRRSGHLACYLSVTSAFNHLRLA
jgi:hypothetical protein